jgi:hypothetical protein
MTSVICYQKSPPLEKAKPVYTNVGSNGSIVKLKHTQGYNQNSSMHSELWMLLRTIFIEKCERSLPNTSKMTKSSERMQAVDE